MNCSCQNRKSDDFGVRRDCKHAENNLVTKKLGNTTDRVITVINPCAINLDLSSNESRKVGLKRQFQMCGGESLKMGPVRIDHVHSVSHPQSTLKQDPRRARRAQMPKTTWN